MTVEKLQKRFYSRSEIAEIMELAPNDKNFANKVQTRLNNWGYKYHYSSKRVEIKRVPSTVEEKLRELLIRKLSLDKQTNLKAFAIVMYLLNTDYTFQTSPWNTGASILYTDYGISIADSTMRNWASKLIQRGILLKDFGTRQVWRTYINKYDIKCQERVSGDEEKMAEYEKFKIKRSQYLEEADRAYQEKSNTNKISPTRWKYTFSKLWNEFNCCYYNVKPFVFNAWYDEDYHEIFSLTEEIVQNLIL